ncbi:MAG: hypothetical protein ACRD5K_00855 [Candidatus Acidiferrales bacterium]
MNKKGEALLQKVALVAEEYQRQLLEGQEGAGVERLSISSPPAPKKSSGANPRTKTRPTAERASHSESIRVAPLSGAVSTPG